MSRTGQGWVGALVALAASAILVAGCSDDRRRSWSASTSAPATSSSGPTLVTSASSAAPIPTTLDLTPALRADLARTFAPQLRFNAYYDDGNRSPQNRHEDLFPMGISSFLREVTSGRARVLVQGSRGDTPGASEVRTSTHVPVFGAQAFGPYPRNMVGDPPGQAPLYVTVYEDLTLRSLASDGSGERVVYLDYWIFYPQDRSEAQLLNVIPTPGNLDVTGHRADWEHVSYRVRVQHGPGVTVLSGDLEEAVYWAHGHGYLVTAPELERVDDSGQPDPLGPHGVIYVSQGKHGCYPQAGEWKDHSFPPWVADHTDFFRGNGVVVAGWQAPLHDLDDPAGDPAAFASPELQTVVARSIAFPAPLTDWTVFLGRWGPDPTLVTTSFLGIGTSPAGPKARSYWNDFHGQGAYPTWVDHKARTPRLRIYGDVGITIPPSALNPAPLRR